MQSSDTSWTLNATAAPNFIMGDYEKILMVQQNRDSFCLTCGNNASRKSFTEGRLPENCLAAKRVLMRGTFTRLDTALCLLASKHYFRRNPQNNWFNSFHKVLLDSHAPISGQNVSMLCILLYLVDVSTYSPSSIMHLFECKEWLAVFALFVYTSNEC